MHIPGILQPIHLPEDTISHRGGTGLYVVGKERLALIDTGSNDQPGAAAVLAGLSARADAHTLDYVLITHSHRDHVGGLATIYQAIVASSGSPPAVRAHPLTVETLRNDWDFPYAQPLLDGEEIVIGGATLATLHTPGHSRDHICFFEPRSATLFSGDLVLGASTSIVFDVPAALASLRRLLALQARLLCPGHGPMREDATRRIRTYIAHRYLRERQILKQLQSGPRTSRELTNAIYTRVDPRLLRLAERNVLAHLNKLEQEGRVTALLDGVTRFALTNGGGR